MTFPKMRIGPGGTRPFNGTDAERARNRLSHSWVQVLRVEKRGKYPMLMVEKVGNCKVCDGYSDREVANWPCGKSEILGPREYIW